MTMHHEQRRQGYEALTSAPGTKYKLICESIREYNENMMSTPCPEKTAP